MSAKPVTRKVDLTDEELVLLDGRVRPEAQVAVDLAKHTLALSASGVAPHIAAFVAAVVEEAASMGRLVYYHRSLSYCRIGSHGGKTIDRGRNGRRLRTPRTVPLPGIEMAHRFVTMSGYAQIGGCAECVAEALPHLRAALADVRAEIPEPIGGRPPRWKWNQNRRCTKCGWEGHEGEMRRARTLLGDGWYQAGCPKCDAENALTRTPVEHRDGFTLTEAA